MLLLFKNENLRQDPLKESASSGTTRGDGAQTSSTRASSTPSPSSSSWSWLSRRWRISLNYARLLCETVVVVMCFLYVFYSIKALTNPEPNSLILHTIFTNILTASIASAIIHFAVTYGVWTHTHSYTLIHMHTHMHTQIHTHHTYIHIIHTYTTQILIHIHDCVHIAFMHHHDQSMQSLMIVCVCVCV